MGFFGLKDSGPPKGSERVLAYLVEAQRSKAPFRIEDARGHEVPATLDLITEKRVTLTPREPLGLARGAGTHLVFIMDGLRFTAATRMLELEPGMATVELPRGVNLAERRKMSRGYLNAREGAAAVAMAGLFNPLASGSLESMGSRHALVDEPGERSVPMEGSRVDSLSLPGNAEVPDAGSFQSAVAQKPWTGKHAGTGTTFWSSYVVDWLKIRNITLNSHTTTSVVEQSVKAASGDYLAPINGHSILLVERSPFLGRNPTPKKLGNEALTHGVTYTFMSRSVSGTWRQAFMMSSVKFEAFCAANAFRLGIRIK